VDVLVHVDVVRPHLQLALKLRIHKARFDRLGGLRGQSGIFHVLETAPPQPVRSKSKPYRILFEKREVLIHTIASNNCFLVAKMPTSTRERILRAAESLFSQYGRTGVTLRQITGLAQVNVAAINYHFYDLDGLYRELVGRRLGQINRDQLDLLAVAQSRFGDDPVPLPEIFDALARPLFLPSPATGQLAPRLIGRLLSERQPSLDPLLRELFQPTMTRFGQALRRHQPALPPTDFVWRLNFVIGALHHTLVTLPDLSQHTSGLCRADDCAGALRNFNDFASKAFAA
jgi:AcrR family transcriptional regulator